MLTHSDGDHTGIAPVLRDAGARVLIHLADDATLRKPGPKGGDASPANVLTNLWRPATLKVLAHMLRHGGAKPARVNGAETFADGDVLDVPGHFRVLHTPGHTAGQCALLAQSHRVLFAGDSLIDHDLVTKGRGPQIMPRFTNVDSEQALASLDAIAAVDDDGRRAVRPRRTVARRRSRGRRIGTRLAAVVERTIAKTSGWLSADETAGSGSRSTRVRARVARAGRGPAIGFPPSSMRLLAAGGCGSRRSVAQARLVAVDPEQVFVDRRFRLVVGDER